MKFIFTSMMIFCFTFSAYADTKPERLDFNSYVRENFQILSRVKKPEKMRLAFVQEKAREPAVAADQQNIGYGVDKSGNVAASSGSIWGSMGGQQNPNNTNQNVQGYQMQPAPPPSAPAAPPNMPPSGAPPLQ